jgi:hypothetical protein
MLEGFGEMANKMISSGHRQEGGQHGPGTFTSSSFVMSSSSGRDGSGRPHVEAFSESTVGGRDSGGALISETRQQYKNSATAQQRVALEQAHGRRAMKVVRERSGGSDSERTHELFREMTREDAGAFRQQFERSAQGVLPPRHERHRALEGGGGDMAKLLCGGNGGDGRSGGGGRDQPRLRDGGRDERAARSQRRRGDGAGASRARAADPGEGVLVRSRGRVPHSSQQRAQRPGRRGAVDGTGDSRR